MSAIEISFTELESLPPHPQQSSNLIAWLFSSGVALCLLAVALVWHPRELGVVTGGSARCRLVTLPNAGVPYQTRYECADGSVFYPQKPLD